VKLEKNKNFKYDKLPWRWFDEGHEKFDPTDCYLKSFNRVDDKINLFFRNENRAVIRAVNAEGGREMDSIEEKLNEFVGKSYQEILTASF
jgi:hypothetical protein